MPWVKVDDHFDENPKIAASGPLGVALWMAGLAYCNRTLTDGFIPRAVARTLLDYQFDLGDKRYTVSVVSGMQGEDATADLVIAILIENGLWEEAVGGYLVHDYSDYQPSKAQVLAEREAAKKRMTRVRTKPTARSEDVRAKFERSSATPVPVPVPVPSSEIDIQPLRAERLTEAQQETFDHLHERVSALILVANGPPTGWGEDLIKRGATRTDVDHAVQASLGKGLAYVRECLLSRVKEREKGRDPDAERSQAPVAFGSNSNGRGPRSMAPPGGGYRPTGDGARGGFSTERPPA